MASDPTAFLILQALTVFCFAYPFVMAWYWMFGGLLFWIGVERHYPPINQPPKLAVPPPISIIVPCHNESETATETFGALAAIDYPEFEIIAVNDGSRD